VGELVTSMPSWAGTIPQWGILLSFVFAVWKISFADSTAIRKELSKRIEELKADHSTCLTTLQHLQDSLNGMRKQRVSEQIAIMRAILKTVEDPALRKQLEMLEALNLGDTSEYVGEVLGDTDNV
jgi:hypothetical protein